MRMSPETLKSGTPVHDKHLGWYVKFESHYCCLMFPGAQSQGHRLMQSTQGGNLGVAFRGGGAYPTLKTGLSQLPRWTSAPQDSSERSRKGSDKGSAFLLYTTASQGPLRLIRANMLECSPCLLHGLRSPEKAVEGQGTAATRQGKVKKRQRKVKKRQRWLNDRR